MTVKTRIAPSNTGGAHFGMIRTALFNYLHAKKTGGNFLMRIEDTDLKRCSSESEAHIYESLKWFGLSFDNSPFKQSERDYSSYAKYLVDNGFAYYAFDTDSELEVARDRWKNTGIKGGYGTLTRDSMCNSLVLPAENVKERIERGDSYVIRFKIPKGVEVRYEDGVLGWICIHSSELDDKILMKSGGKPAYHLANVCDDHEMGITHVLRGNEWVSSTPLHILLYGAFGWNTPKFYHLPLILDKDGKKFSKRTALKLGISVFPLSWSGIDEESGEFKTVLGFKELGYEPEAVLNYLVLLGWNPGGNESEIMSVGEMIEKFDLNRINKSGAKFDVDKLNHINAHYVRSLSVEDIMVELGDSLKGYDSDKVDRILSLLKERAVFRKDYKPLVSMFVLGKRFVLHGVNDEIVGVFKAFVDGCGSIGWNGVEIKGLLTSICEDRGLKIGKVMPDLRRVLTGELKGPDMMTMMEVLGRDEVCHRLKGLWIGDN